MQIELLRGADAAFQLSQLDFRDEWDSLCVDCPWATGFQTGAFIRVWYSVYETRYEPLVVVGRGADGTLLGGLALSVDHKNNALVPCGWPNAEYYVWIARPAESDEFLSRALRKLWELFPAGRLSLHYLPPGTPVESLSAATSAFERVFLRSVPRPVRELARDSSSASLGKKSNKSRINRLRKLGQLQFIEFSSRGELEPLMDKVAIYCDLRQGAANNSLPFRSDPLKRELFLRLVDEPGLSHASALMVGEELAAIHIGVRSRTDVSLGLIAHSPFLIRHSPGKLLLLYLSGRLAEQGFARLDLTPAGDFKERFQNVLDTAYSFWAFARRSDFVRFVWTLRVRAAARSILNRIPPLPKNSVSRMASRLAGRSVFGMLGAARSYVLSKLHSSIELRYYYVEPKDLPEDDAGLPALRVNHIEDLLCYRPATPQDRTVQQFLQDSLDRLARGDRVFTFVENGLLLHYSWLAWRSGKVSSGLGLSFEYPENAAVLWDDYTDPAGRGRGLHTRSLLARPQYAFRNGVKRVYVDVFASNLTSRRNIERNGYIHFGSIIRRVRFGKASVRWSPA